MPTHQIKKSPESSFVAYLLVLLFVCVCLAILISQRLRIARRGRAISRLYTESIKLRTQECRLRLRVAEGASYRSLIRRGKEMGIKLVPPEQAVAPMDATLSRGPR